MLSDKEIIHLLYDYGHLGGGHLEKMQGLKNSADVSLADLDKLTLKDKAVKEALASFQGFMAHDYEALAIQHRGTRTGMFGEAHVENFGDGESDEAARRLFEVPRCGMPDILPDGGFSASGSWQEPCRSQGVTFFVDKTNIPSTYAAFWDSDILPSVISAFRRVGAAMKQIQDKNAANIFNSFPALFGSTIGLASLHAGSCSSKGFCRLDRDFRCNKEDAKKLLAHEWCHNWNHNHTRTGLLAPSMSSNAGPFVGFEGDASMPTWVRFTDGKPLPPLEREVTPDDFNTAL